MPGKPAEGLTCTETLDRFLAEKARDCYAPDRPQWGRPDLRARLLILGDEIGPATLAEYINLLPLLKGTFHEYLQRQGLAPEFFGKTNWADVEAFTYRKIREGSEAWDTLVRIMAAQGLEPPKTVELPEEKLVLKNPSRASAEEVDLSRLEEEKQAGDRLHDASGREASLAERRLYHWTQRFRSWYTTRFYGLSHAELQRVARDELRLPWKPRACPNFQAMPIMCGQMWDGALNLFEWARSGTTDYLSAEDWINGPYRVAFGMRLLKAAGRKRGQELGHLIVADRGHFQRYLMSLGAGSRGFLSYLYGPLRVIGPAWADSKEISEMWAKALRWTGRCEADLLASSLRPAEAAILVANTSEINTAYRHTALYAQSRPLRDRYDIFAALMDAQVPVEIVGEEEIIEDDALARYRALYVSDPHVDSRAQARIRAWVEQGGVLWASHAGLARQEYDEPSPLFDEVFGLAGRGETLSTPESLEPAERIVVATNDLIPAVAFKAAPCRPAWVLGPAEVLARYDDGTPVLIRNRFGKGQSFLLGNAAYACTGGYDFEVDEPPEAAASREVVAVAARAAGVRPHVRLNHTRVLWSVMDGPDQTVLVLANCFVEDLPGLAVEVLLPRKPARAYSGRADNVPFEWLGDRARVTLDLARGDGEILVFRL
jgi:hypothetical protein